MDSQPQGGTNKRKQVGAYQQRDSSDKDNLFPRRRFPIPGTSCSQQLVYTMSKQNFIGMHLRVVKFELFKYCCMQLKYTTAHFFHGTLHLKLKYLIPHTAAVKTLPHYSPINLQPGCLCRQVPTQFESDKMVLQTQLYRSPLTVTQHQEKISIQRLQFEPDTHILWSLSLSTRTSTDLCNHACEPVHMMSPWDVTRLWAML